MASLGSPTVYHNTSSFPNLTPAGREVLVQNAVPGATVTVFQDGDVVAFGTATWPDQVLTLTKELVPNRLVWATQAQAGFAPSPESDKVKVGAMPTAAEIGAGQFDPVVPPYCARCIRMSGLVPGARIEVVASVTGSRGKARVDPTGRAHVDLDIALRQHDVLNATQTAQSTPTQVTGNIASQAVGPRSATPLPTPKIVQPIKCDRAIVLQGLQPGAHVKVSRGGVDYSPFCVSTAGWTLTGIEPLMPQPAAHDDIRAQLLYPDPDCGIPGAVAGPMAVLDKNPDPPGFKPPVCVGASRIWVESLRPGGTLEVTIDGNVWPYGIGSTAAFFPLPIPSPVHEGSKIHVRQRVCGDDLSLSGSVSVSAATLVPATPKPFSPTGANISITPSVQFIRLGDYCNPVSQITNHDVEYGPLAAGATSPAAGKVITIPAITGAVTGVGLMTIPLFATLKNSTVYAWRVRANRAGVGSSPWSAWTAFTTVAVGGTATPPPAPPGGGGMQRFTFCETCPGNFSKRPIIGMGHDLAEALHDAESKAGSTCNVDPLPLRPGESCADR